MFKSYLNKPPLRFLNSYRLERSMSLLQQTELSITEIAQQCGFSGPSYFAELFMREKGLTPSTYRRRACSAEHHNDCPMQKR
ncbi:helix-turn-helix transcriptional regulator [Oscillospiraceae bacterium OttesenSCG-928-F05]|nr:helix-turn-helix transcriptional regulator [Oscillospiraceae bacterium OttesenSCG-928-F05]